MIRMLSERKTILFRILKYLGIVLFLLLLLLPAKYINTMYGYLPFLSALFILIISVTGMLLLRRGMTVESDSDDAQCMRGESVRISLKVRNRSPFLCPRARAVIYISDLFGNSDDETDIEFAMTARSVSDFSFDMDMLHLGTYRVGIRKLSVYDMTGLFQIAVPISGGFRVNVAPRIRTMDELDISDDVLMESETDTRVSSAGGMNYTGVREYEFGDSIKNIHWKLSAHSAVYMTKINEINRQNDYVILIDTASPRYSSEELMDIYDCLVETAAAVLNRISDRDVVFSLLFPNRHLEVERWNPSGNDYAGMIRDLSVLTPDPDPDYPDGASMLIDEASMMNRSANVILCTSRVTDDLVQELLRVKQQKRSPELFYIYPESLTSREVETLTAPLEELGSAGVEYHMISTAVNRSYMNEEEADRMETVSPGFGNGAGQREHQSRTDRAQEGGSRTSRESRSDRAGDRNRSDRTSTAERRQRAGREDAQESGYRTSRSSRPDRTGDRSRSDRAGDRRQSASRSQNGRSARSSTGPTIRRNRNVRTGSASGQSGKTSRTRTSGGERK